jgi:hypothetical protein
MKAYELMKLVKENPQKYDGKQFKVTKSVVVDMNGQSYKEFKINKHGEFTTGVYRLFINDIAEVEEIKQPIPFLEAVQAYAEGKTIRCESKEWGTRIYQNKETHKMLKDDENMAIDVEEILEGVWYIEDGE